MPGIKSQLTALFFITFLWAYLISLSSIVIVLSFILLYISLNPLSPNKSLYLAITALFISSLSSVIISNSSFWIFRFFNMSVFLLITV